MAASLRAPSGSRLFPPPGSRLVLTALSRTSPRRVVRNAGWRQLRPAAENRIELSENVVRSGMLVVA